MDIQPTGSIWRKSMTFWRLLPAALALAALPSCSGSNPAGPNGPTRTVLGTQNGTLASFTAAAHPVFANANGTFDATLDWGNSGNDFDIFVTSNACATTSLADLENQVGVCSHIVSARSTSTKPERVTWSGTANVTYKIWVANFGNSTDSYTLTAGITS